MRSLTALRSEHAPWLTKKWLSTWFPAFFAAILLIAMLLEVSRSTQTSLYVFAAMLAAVALAISRCFAISAHIALAISVVLYVVSEGWVGWYWLTIVLTFISASMSTRNWRDRLVAGTLVLVGLGLAGMVSDVMIMIRWSYRPHILDPVDAFRWPLWMGGIWGFSLVIRIVADSIKANRQLIETERRAETTESALRDEQLRTDLTRDFHDIMAHSLAVLAAQAEGLRLTHEKHPERIAPVLETISETARLSLIEVRELLERGEQAEQLSLDDLAALVTQVRSAGLPVSVHTIGEAQPLGRAGELAAYRIAQEALTNALRHADHGSDVRAVLAWIDPGLSMTITSSMPAGAAGDFEPGRGIRGMRERAGAVGGAVETSIADGMFVVSAFLPTQPELAASEALGGGAPSRDVNMNEPASVPNPLAAELGKTV